MAGTVVTGIIQASTVSDGTNSTSATNCIKGSAKAWVRWDTPTTPNILGSYNVSSVTYITAGNWNINFTNPLSSANYVAVGSNNGLTGVNNFVTNFGANFAGGQYSTTACSVACQNNNGAGINASDMRAAFFGN